MHYESSHRCVKDAHAEYLACRFHLYIFINIRSYSGTVERFSHHEFSNVQFSFKIKIHKLSGRRFVICYGNHYPVNLWVPTLKASKNPLPPSFTVSADVLLRLSLASTVFIPSIASVLLCISSYSWSINILLNSILQKSMSVLPHKWLCTSTVQNIMLQGSTSKRCRIFQCFQPVKSLTLDHGYDNPTPTAWGLLWQPATFRTPLILSVLLGRVHSSSLKSGLRQVIPKNVAKYLFATSLLDTGTKAMGNE